jgi:hypothetical protein
MFWRSASTCHRNTSCMLKCCCQSVYCCRIRYSLSGYALLAAYRTVANDFNAK